MGIHSFKNKVAWQTENVLAAVKDVLPVESEEQGQHHQSLLLARQLEEGHSPVQVRVDAPRRVGSPRLSPRTRRVRAVAEVLPPRRLRVPPDLLRVVLQALVLVTLSLFVGLNRYELAQVKSILQVLSS